MQGFAAGSRWCQDVIPVVTYEGEHDSDFNYSPHRINSFLLYGMPSAFHEYGHVVDLWRKGKPQCLLKKEFGFVPTRITMRGIKAEAFANMFSYMLTQEAMPELKVKNYYTDSLWLAFRVHNLRRRGGVESMTATVWLQMLEDTLAEIQAVGMDAYLEDFKAAMQFIKANRLLAEPVI